MCAGAVIQPPQNCWLILEYLPGGSLAEWLYGRDGRGAPKRSMHEKVNMALEIAQGMLVRMLLTVRALHSWTRLSLFACTAGAGDRRASNSAPRPQASKCAAGCGWLP